MIFPRSDSAVDPARRAVLASLASFGLLAVTQGALKVHAATNSDVIEMWLGSNDAVVEVREYASMTCPHCARFHENVYPELKAEYIDTGKIRFVFREVYFDRSALWASMLARCAGPTRYFSVIDLLFERQDDWSRQSDPVQVTEQLFRIGRIAGMSDETIKSCMSDRDFALAMIEKSDAERQGDNVNSTPNLVINGVNHGNLNYEKLKALIDDELGS
ncbi:MAG: DsbA family protein [Rhodobacteraceae bacterium]|nr:DsbA family protein [Paracoccaceae bacterium]